MLRWPIRMVIAVPLCIKRNMFVKRGAGRTTSFIQSSIYTATTSS